MTTPERIGTERAFAKLCGVAPVDASSGQQIRHRLNRGGNRQANRALHTMVILRLRLHEPTRSYMERRLAEGKTKKEVIRCLKRYAAREIYSTCVEIGSRCRLTRYRSTFFNRASSRTAAAPPPRPGGRGLRPLWAAVAPSFWVASGRRSRSSDRSPVPLCGASQRKPLRIARYGLREDHPCAITTTIEPIAGVEMGQ